MSIAVMRSAQPYELEDANLRVDGGCAGEDPSSLARLLLREGPAPRFADDMLGRSGELKRVREKSF